MICGCCAFSPLPLLYHYNILNEWLLRRQRVRRSENWSRRVIVFVFVFVFVFLPSFLPSYVATQPLLWRLKKVYLHHIFHFGLEKCGCETTLSFYFEVTRSVKVRFEKSATDQQSSDESAPKPPSRRSVEEVRLEKCACETTLSF